MNRQKPEDVIGATRPFTGKEYLESLRDGREVYIYGERVKDVTTHPAFRNAARTIARLYDALHDPKQKDVLTCPTDTGAGTFTHKFFRVAHSREDLIGQRDAIAPWARLTYGWMGRSPDYKASLMNTLGANAPFYEKFADNAKHWYARSQNHVLFMNHAIVNPPVDRMKAADQVKDVFITIQKETDAGIVVSGAKVVATSAAHHALQFHGPERDRDADQRHRSRDHVHRADERAGREADLPRVLRDDGGRHGHAVRLSAVVALRRERRDLRVRQRADPLGERAAPPRHREDQGVLPALGLSRRLPVPGLHAARGEARLPGRPDRQGAARGRLRRVPRQPGDARRGDRLAQSVLGAVRRDGDEPDALGRRRRAAERAVRLGLSRVRGRSLFAHQGDRGEDRRVVADLSAVVGEGFRQSRRSSHISSATCAAPTASTTRSASRS